MADIESPQVFDKNKETKRYLVLTLAIFTLVEVLFLVTSKDSGLWLLALIAIGIVQCIVMDILLSTNGLIRKYREKSFLQILLIQTVVAYLTSLSFVNFTLPQSFAVSFLAFIGLSTGMSFSLSLSPITRAILLSKRPIVMSGDIKDGTVSGLMPQEVLDKFEDSFICQKIKKSLEKVILEKVNTSKLPKWKTFPKSQFHYMQLFDHVILFRLNKKVVEVLFIPQSGLISRFEEARDVADEISFSLWRDYHIFGSVQNSDEVIKDVKAAYADYRARNEKPIKILEPNYWTTRKVAYVGLSSLSIIALSLTVVFWGGITEWLSVTANFNMTSTIFMIVTAIVSMVSLGVAWKGRAR